MQIVDAADKLGEETACNVILEVAMVEDVVKKFTARGVLKNNSDILVVLNNLF